VATDLLARIRGELEERMTQLRPLLSEYERLMTVADTLASTEAEAAASVASPPAARRPSGARSAAASPRRRARGPRGSAAGAIERAASTLAAVDPIEPQASPAPEPPSSPAASAPAAAPQPPRSRRASASATAGEPPTSTSVAAATSAEIVAWDDDEDEPQREPASPEAVQQAILAALEHGSHTVSELVMVTAMSGPEIRANLSRIVRRGKVAKVKRDGDGKTAYALSPALAQV
jgi:hypothetical protein